MNDTMVFGHTPDDDSQPPRSAWRAVGRGFLCRCPNCGRGHLFASFARAVDHCEACGEDMHHHRADDFPAYINIFIVGHIVLAGFVIVEALTTWPGWVNLAIWVPITIILALVLLQPIKGAVIGFQWARYLHGFGGETDDIEPWSASGHD